jgi:V-type H+-transporting ATPase subunit E
MNETEARDRIRQMISFIIEEAKDKAREIKARTENEYNLTKSKHLFQGKEKIMADNEKAWKLLETKRKIDESAAINAAMMEIMKARAECMSQLIEEARAELSHQSSKSPGSYKKVLENLIIQGLIKLLEPHVTVQCRASDVNLVREVLDSSRSRYLDIMKKSTGKDYELQLEIDSVHLPPALHDASHGSFCSGGVILHSNHGRIRCINTLDDRLSAVIAYNTPMIRKMLFS